MGDSGFVQGTGARSTYVCVAMASLPDDELYVTETGRIEKLGVLKGEHISMLKKNHNTHRLACTFEDPLSGNIRFLRAYNSALRIQTVWRARKHGAKAREKYDVIYRNRNAVMDMCCYIIFFLLVIVSTVIRAPSRHVFMMQNKLKDLIIDEEFDSSDSHIMKNFGDVGSEEELWQYLSGPLAGNLFPSDCYGSKDVEDVCVGKPFRTVSLVGGVRLRQLRGESVSKTACTKKIPAYFKSVSGHESCQESYSEWYGRKVGLATISRLWEGDSAVADAPKTPDIPIGNAAEVSRLNISSCFKYTYGHSSSLGTMYLSADQYGLFPSGIGYTCDLLVKEGWKVPSIIAALKSNSWFGDTTRALFVEMTLFNPSLSIISTVRLLFEFPITGGIATSSVFGSASLIANRPALHTIVDETAQGVVSLFCIAYIIVEFKEIRRKGCKQYFTEFWNYVDILNYVSLIASNLISLQLRYMEAEVLGIAADSSQYVSFQEYVEYSGKSSVLSSFVAIICTIKVFKYLQASPNLSILIETLQQAAGTLGYFFIVLFVLTFGFALAFYSTFNTYSFEFRTVDQSFFTLFSALIGVSPDYAPLMEGNRFVAPVLYISYIFFVAVIAFSFILTIITDEYMVVKERVQQRVKDKDMDMLMNRLRHGVGRVKMSCISCLLCCNSDNVKRKRMLMKCCGFNVRRVLKRRKKNRGVAIMRRAKFSLLRKYSTNDYHVKIVKKRAPLQSIYVYPGSPEEKATKPTPVQPTEGSSGPARPPTIEVPKVRLETIKSKQPTEKNPASLVPRKNRSLYFPQTDTARSHDTAASSVQIDMSDSEHSSASERQRLNQGDEDSFNMDEMDGDMVWD